MVEAEGDEGEASLVHAELVALALAGVDAAKDSLGVAGGFVEVAGHFGDGDGEVKGEVGRAEGDGVCGEVGGGLFEGGGGVLAFGKVGIKAELFEGGAEDGKEGVVAVGGEVEFGALEMVEGVDGVSDREGADGGGQKTFIKKQCTFPSIVPL